MNTTRTLGIFACISLAGAAVAATGDTTTADLQAQIERLQKSLEQVQSENKANKQELTELKSQNGDKWLTEERAAQIKGVVQDVIADSDSRASLQASGATAGYDKGFFLASPDGNFRLVVGGQIQARYAYNRLSSNSLNGFPATAGVQRSARGFELRRVKVDFSGNVIDPSWTYKITTIYNDYGSGAGATGATSPTAGSGAGVANGSIEDAWINKDFGNGFSLKVGQFKAPLNREELVSSKYQLCVERSLVNQLFSMKFTQGIALTAKNDNLMGIICFNDGGNDANTSAVIGNTNLAANAGYTQYALTGRMQWLAFGNWKQFDSFTSARGDTQGLMFGGAFNWQRGGVGDNTVPANGNGDVSMFTYTADAQWMLGGANIFGSFFGNTATSVAGVAPATTNGSSIFTYGATLQAGYYVSDEVEIFGRFEWYDTLGNGANNMRYGAAGPTSNPFSSQHNTIYTVGLNWYISGKTIKWTTDFGYAANGVMFTNGLYAQSIAGADYRQDSAIGNGGQFVFRTQLQLLF